MGGRGQEAVRMEDRGEESTKEDAVGEPPGDEEGDIYALVYARSSGLMKAIFFEMRKNRRMLV